MTEILRQEGKTESGIFYRLEKAIANCEVRPTLVLIMGYGGSLRIWPESLIKNLAQKYDVLTYDNRGTGLSLLPPSETDYTTEIMAQDLQSIAQHLGLQKFHLLGYSMGGCIAIDYARQFPDNVESLFLLSTTGGGSLYHKPERAVSEALANPQGKTLWEIYEWTFRLMYSPQSYVQVEPILKQLYEAAKATPTRPQALKGHTHAFKNFDGTTFIKALTMPVRIMSGENDRLIPVKNSQALAAALPQSRLVLVPGCEHGPQIEVEELFIAEIARLTEQP